MYDLKYQYDLDGRRMELDYPTMWSQLPTTYHYTPFGELKDVNSPEATGHLIGYTYDLDGRLDSLAYPNGVVESRKYDDDSRMIDLLQTSPLNGYPHPGGDPQTIIHHARLGYDARGSITSVGLLGLDTIANTYDGLGQLRSMARQVLNNDGTLTSMAQHTEQYDMDPMGNSLQTVLPQTGGTADVRQYDQRTGRLFVTSSGSSNTFNAGTNFFYDSAGNEIVAVGSRPAKNVNGGAVQVVQQRLTAYDADQHPRFFHLDGAGIELGPNQADLFPEDSLTDQETRYDALGRRVWVRTSHLTNACSRWCSAQRFIWDGDQLLGETHYQGGNNKDDLSAPSLEYDTTTVTEVHVHLGVVDTVACQANGQCGDSSTVFTQFWGRVSYTHGTGIDQPLAVLRMGAGYETTLLNPLVFYPHLNWRGQMTDVSWSTSPTRVLSQNIPVPLMPLAADADIGAYDARVHQQAGITWMGGLIDHQSTETGLEYMRNRYYDPNTGRFTQEDPMGLAGGMNLYGFAAGDPIDFNDPFGLCPPKDDNTADCAAGTSGWYANRLATGQGNSILNTIGGLLATCNESALCSGVLDVASMGAEALERRAASAAVEGALSTSEGAHAAQEGAAAAGKSWTTQRRAFWKAESTSEGAAERWGADNVGRMERGLAPKVGGKSVELHHTPVPQRAGGTRVIPVTPEQHGQIDPFRRTGTP